METVAVSQAPVVFGASAPVSPLFARRAGAAFPPAVQDLARSFVSLAGSTSLGAVAGLAGTTVPASGEWVLLCPSASGVGAVTGSAVASAPARTNNWASFLCHCCAQFVWSNAVWVGGLLFL